MLRIKEAREARGWTQEQLATEMNTTQQTIQRWETGQTDPKATAVKEISRILGVTVSFIMNVNEQEDSDCTSDLLPYEHELIRLFRKCDTYQKNSLLNALKKAAGDGKSLFVHVALYDQFDKAFTTEEVELMRKPNRSISDLVDEITVEGFPEGQKEWKKADRKDKG